MIFHLKSLLKLQIILYQEEDKAVINMNNQMICQSCGILLTNDILGTNIDGSLSPYYCKYCFLNGAFTENLTLAQAIESVVSYGTDNGLNREEALRYAKMNLPLLKRWKQ